MSLSNYIKEIRQSGERHFTLEKLMTDMKLSKNAALNAIHRIREQGELISPLKGLYVIVPRFSWWHCIKQTISQAAI